MINRPWNTAPKPIINPNLQKQRISQRIEITENTDVVIDIAGLTCVSGYVMKKPRDIAYELDALHDNGNLLTSGAYTYNKTLMQITLTNSGDYAGQGLNTNLIIKLR